MRNSDWTDRPRRDAGDRVRHQHATGGRGTQLPDLERGTALRAAAENPDFLRNHSDEFAAV